MEVADRPGATSLGDRLSAPDGAGKVSSFDSSPRNTAKIESPKSERVPNSRPERDEKAAAAAEAPNEPANNPSEKKTTLRLVMDHPVAFGVSAVLLVAILIAGTELPSPTTSTHRVRVIDL
jgi:hypothetical protein